jgi:hypothetical protein
MKVFLFTLFIFTALSQNVLWKKFPNRSECEPNFHLETTIIKPKECSPMIGSRKNEYVAAACTDKKTTIKRCTDSTCGNCQTQVYDNNKCYLDEQIFVKQTFSCGVPEPLKDVDFTFKYFGNQRCEGKSIDNIVRGHCIHISERLSWINFCNTKDGRIWIRSFNSGNCSGAVDEESSRPTGICQPTWLGSRPVIFGNCKKK